MFRTILVAVDGSDHSEKALKLASDLAVKYRAKLILLHVLLRDASSDTLRRLASRKDLTKELRDTLDNYEAEGMAMMASAGDMYVAGPILPPSELVEAIGVQVVERARAQAKKTKVARVSTVLANGDPADAILKNAKKAKADMIVLGSRGFGHLKGLLLGSVSHKVASHAECTCVTVK